MHACGHLIGSRVLIAVLSALGTRQFHPVSHHADARVPHAVRAVLLCCRSAALAALTVHRVHALPDGAPVHLVRHLVEGLLDVVAHLGGHFHVEHFVALGEHLRLFRADAARHDHVRLASLLLVLHRLHQVQFEPDQDAHDVFGGVGVQILQPKVHSVEGVLLRQIEADKGATNVIIVHASDLPVSFLPCRVPHVHLHELGGLEPARVRVTLPQLDRLDLEVPGQGRLRAVLIEHV